MNPHRKLFHLPQATYLLSHSVGCLPRATDSAKEHFFALWREQGSEAWDFWLDQIESFRLALARLLHGQPSEFSPQVNISSAVSKILPALPRRPSRRKILFTDLDFPSVGFALSQAERLGYQLEIIRSQNGRIPTALWRQHLSDDVQMVLVTHSFYGSSTLNPVPEIIQWARGKGIITVVDIAQSAGVVPIDVAAWDADIVVGSCIKWLCGGPGAGFLWANPDSVDQFQPTDVGWFSHQNPFEFDMEHFAYAPGADRFWGGTPSVLPYALASSSLNLISEIGVDQVRAHNIALTSRLVAWAKAHKLLLLTPDDPNLRGGTVCITFPAPGHLVCQELREYGILVDSRPGFGVRFSPHIYNDMADIDAAVKYLQHLL